MAEGYLYDQAWEKERQRIAGMEALWDPGTIAELERLGVAEGWRCLDVGAGGGTVAQWLAGRVGEGGHVVAADLDTRYLEPVAADNLEVVQNDITAGAPGEGFDLVHARLLLEHIPDTDALANMVAATKPGGWLLLEDYDFASSVGYPAHPLADRVQDAVLGFMSEVGSFDPNYGRRLVGELRAAGLDQVEGDGRVRVLYGGTPGTDFFRFSLESLRAVLTERGDATDAEIDECLALFDDPDRVLLSPAMIAARGRRPA